MSQQPHGGYPQPPRPQQRPETSLPPPVAYEAVGGTPFGVAIVSVAPTPSGPATASLVTGVASVVVSLVVVCFGTLGGNGGWGPIVAGAFAVLAVFLGVAALLLARVGLRQIRRTAGWSTLTGRGLAISGAICGGVGLVFTVLALIGSIALANNP